MADDPREEVIDWENEVVARKCLTGQQKCEDCRDRPLDEIVSLHFTICQKPWWCTPHYGKTKQSKVCRAFTHEWYKARSELEQSWGHLGMGTSKWDRDHFFGYCHNATEEGYTRMEKPIPPMHDSVKSKWQ